MSAKAGAASDKSQKIGARKIPEPQSTKDSSAEYGREGTNKTIPEPKADSAPSEELGNTQHVNKSPYTRG